MTKNDEQLLGTLIGVFSFAVLVIGIVIAVCYVHRDPSDPPLGYDRGIQTCNGAVVLHDHERATFIAAHDGCLYMESPPEHVDYSPALVGR